MKNRFHAIYENGTLRPLEGLGLKEGERVTVSILSESTSPSAEECKCILDQISLLASSNDSDHFSGQDHDAILYGDQPSP
jgi:predicted DNA-binding antitoxin AbrB/MazE fold protein